jgi:hypothetical protein
MADRVEMGALLVIRARFEADLAIAIARAAQGSAVVATRWGPIEVQQAGDGIPLLVIHGSGGGHDQAVTPPALSVARARDSSIDSQHIP